MFSEPVAFGSTYRNYWDNDRLISQYEDVVKQELKRGWVQEELDSGYFLSEIEDMLWSYFPEWALKEEERFAYNKEEESYERYMELV